MDAPYRHLRLRYRCLFGDVHPQQVRWLPSQGRSSGLLPGEARHETHGASRQSRPTLPHPHLARGGHPSPRQLGREPAQARLAYGADRGTDERSPRRWYPADGRLEWGDRLHRPYVWLRDTARRGCSDRSWDLSRLLPQAGLCLPAVERLRCRALRANQGRSLR